MPKDGQPPRADESGDDDAGRNRAGEGNDVFTKDQVNEIVAKSIAEAINARFGKEASQRERAVEKAKLEGVQAFREELGLDDDAIEDFRKWRNKESGASEELSKWRMKTSSLEKELEAARKRADDATTRYKSRLVDTALTDAILNHPKFKVKASAIPDLKVLLSKSLEAGDDDKVFVKGDDGTPLHGKGIADFIGEQLSNRKHFLEPDATGGGGSRSGGPPRLPDKPDFTDARNVGDYFAQTMKPTSKN